MTKRYDRAAHRNDPASTVDPELRESPDHLENVSPMDDVDRDAGDTGPLRAAQPDDQEDQPMQSEDGDMFLHSEDDTDF